MATQQMRSSGGYVPLRVQRTFNAMDDGRGGRAAALAESLGVILDMTPKIAKREGDMAFEAGMRARVEGVQRENAKTTNKSMLGFMFSERARDGFDYQDAQIELPMLQMEEMLGMEAALRESRNPDDFRAYIAQRDEDLKGRLEGKSDFYKFTVADSMMKMRGDQAKLFTQWVVSNRDKDRGAAAAAAANAKAAAQAAALESAQLAALQTARSTGSTAPTAAPTASNGLSMGSPVAGPQAGSPGLSMGVEVGSVTSSTKGRGRRERGGRERRQGTQTEQEALGFGNSGGSSDLSFGLMEDARATSVPPAFNPVDERQIVIDNFADFVKTAPQQFGIKEGEAKDLFIKGMVLEADRKNDERSLELLPTEYLNFEQQDLVNTAIDTIRNERMSRESADAAAASADAARELALAEANATQFETDLTMRLASGQITKGQAVEELFSDPYYKAYPDERNKAIERLNKIDNVYVDPAWEQVALSQFQDTAIRAAFNGDLVAFNRAATEAIGSVRSDSARQQIGEIVANSEKWIRDSLFKDLDPFYRNITQAFPSGVGESESLSAQLSGVTKGNSYYAPTVDTDVTAMFEGHMIGLAGDWYAANPDAGRMPYQVKWQIAQQASEMAITMGQAKYGSPAGAGNPGTGEPSDALERLKQRTGN